MQCGHGGGSLGLGQIVEQALGVHRFAGPALSLQPFVDVNDELQRAAWLTACCDGRERGATDVLEE